MADAKRVLLLPVDDSGTAQGDKERTNERASERE